MPDVNGFLINGQTVPVAFGGLSGKPSPSSSNPAALGTAAPGSSTDYARADHVHPKPTPADIGAGTYSKPSGGIPASDLASAVQTSLGKADTAYQKPSGGIPGTDLASGVIPTVPSAATNTPADLGTAAVGTSTKYAREDHVHNKPSYTASEVGAIAAPSSPASGAFLVWNGSAWVAQTLSTWQASSY